MITRPIVLIIEDDLDLRELYEQRLRLEGFDTRLAFDGKTGLELIKDVKPDIILLDLMLPKLDGFSFIKEVKREPNLKDIPIVILSVLWQDEDKERALELGADIYLVKSETTPKVVVETLTKALALKEKNGK